MLLLLTLLTLKALFRVDGDALGDVVGLIDPHETIRQLEHVVAEAVRTRWGSRVDGFGKHR